MVGPLLRWRSDRIDLVEVGGEPAPVHRRAGRVFPVDTVEIEGGLITGYRRVLDPEKIAHVRTGRDRTGRRPPHPSRALPAGHAA
ncbi:hypothetical protein ABZZ36_03085 [Actinacidiphila glaucinigra]|uniref:hypothetical protein n=1 Tax=Actinacidiphila glaucinigra TaxID=235986 RepID=UPI0033BCF880